MRKLFVILIAITQFGFANAELQFSRQVDENVIELMTFPAPPATPPAPLTPVVPDPNSLFAQALEMYEMGLAVRWTDIKGFWVGRCFYFDQENTAVNSFAGYLDPAAGPGFGTMPLAFESTYASGYGADYFDELSSYSSYIKIIKDKIKSENSKGRYSTMSEEPTVNQLYDMEPNNRPDFLTEIRWKDDQIVYKVTNLVQQNLKVGAMKSRIPVAAGQTLFACSYFKRVAD